jgi:hypothetical protein
LALCGGARPVGQSGDRMEWRAGVRLDQRGRWQLNSSKRGLILSAGGQHNNLVTVEAAPLMDPQGAAGASGGGWECPGRAPPRWNLDVLLFGVQAMQDHDDDPEDGQEENKRFEEEMRKIFKEVEEGGQLSSVFYTPYTSVRRSQISKRMWRKT